jgi:uncharacterized repeat protein (TIGR04052 family)
VRLPSRHTEPTPSLSLGGLPVDRRWAPALTLLAALAVPAVACRPASDAPAVASSPARPADAVSHTFRFHARVGDQPFGCADTYTLHGVQVQPTDLRIFVSEFELLTADGDAVPVHLDEVDGWQTAGVALLDFENGTGSCSGGTPDVRMVVEGWSAPADVRGIRFTIGVPFEVNHTDPSRARGPLALTAMHWSWQAGYKFLTTGFRVGDARWQLHVGSTGCQGSMTHVTGCDQPNRARIELAAFDASARSIPLQVETLLPAEALAEDAAPDLRNGCMGEHSDPGCDGPYRALGIDTDGASTRSVPPFIGLR